jgi:hypothetical protein
MEKGLLTTREDLAEERVASPFTIPLVRGGWGRRGGNLQRFWFYLKRPDSLRLASTLTGDLLVGGRVFGHRQFPSLRAGHSPVPLLDLLYGVLKAPMV